MDSKLRAFITESIATVKADAAQIAYSAVGKGIVWAVLDSGIDKSHPHFTHFRNRDLGDRGPIAHKDFSGQLGGDPAALEDVFGHGTHVGGIIAGAMSAAWPDESKPAVRSPK